MAQTLREQVDARLRGMKAMRQPYEKDWKDISKFACSQRSRFLYGESKNDNKKGYANQTSYDSYPRRSFRTLQGGLYSGLSSPARPWFKTKLEDRDLNEFEPVKEYLGELDKLLMEFFAKTGFYQAIKGNYSEIGLFGMGAGIMSEHWEYGAVNQDMTAGEYWIGLNDARRVGSLYRHAGLTVLQLVQMITPPGGKPDWGKIRPEIKNMYDKGDYEKPLQIYHGIEPNTNFREGAMFDGRGMRWRSVWWDEESDKEKGVIRQSGFSTQPFWCPRWEPIGPDTYCSSPGYDALPDMRELHVQAKRKGEATDWMIFPEKIVPSSLRLKNRPKSIVSAANIDKDAVQVPYTISDKEVSVIVQDIDRLHREVDAATYADLFMAITNMEGIQPRNEEELAQRNEEKLTQLGSVVDNVNNEGLAIAIDRAVDILDRRGELPRTDDLPQEAMGQPIKVEFISLLTQMQRSIGLGSIERSIGFIGNLSGLRPEAADRIDVDGTIDEYVERSGTPAKAIASVEEAGEIREQRAQDQAINQAATAAPAVESGAKSAQLLAELRSTPDAEVVP